MCLPPPGIGPAKRAASNNLNRNNQHQVIGSDRQHCRIPQKGRGATTDHSYYRLVGVPGSRALAAPANSLRNLDFLVAQCVALWVTKKADAVPKTNHVGVLVSAALNRRGAMSAVWSLSEGSRHIADVALCSCSHLM